MNPDNSFMPTVSWPNGCDRDNWSNCGNVEPFDPTRNPNTDPSMQACCNDPAICGCETDADCQAPLMCVVAENTCRYP